jgi:hypothetical protein
VWGTHNYPGTVSNSRSAQIDSGIRQAFTAINNAVTSAQVELESTTIGKLLPATEATDPQAVCVQISVASANGDPLSAMAFTVKSSVGIRQRVKAPLLTAMMKGMQYVFIIQKGPACVNRDLSTMVAMSSTYKYPAKYGTLTINGKNSSGSLWALID